MSEQANSNNPLTPILEEIRRVIREEIRAAGSGNGHGGLLTPEGLAEKLKVPLSWVYEQSRQGKIPSRHIGRYLRFNLEEVLASQKAG